MVESKLALSYLLNACDVSPKKTRITGTISRYLQQASIEFSSGESQFENLSTNSTLEEAIPPTTVTSPSTSVISVSTSRGDSLEKRSIPIHKDISFSVPRRNPWIGRRSTLSSRPRRFACQCGATFGKKEHLRRHDEVVHRGVRPYRCDVCDLLFGTKQNMQVHSRTRKHATKAAELERKGREKEAVEGVLALAHM